MSRTRHRLKAKQRAAVQRYQLPELPFSSEAGAHLVTVLSERQLLGLILELLLALGVLDRYLGRRSANREERPC